MRRQPSMCLCQRMSFRYWVAGLALSLMTVIVNSSAAVKHEPIAWSARNNIFQENRVISVNIGDEMDFVCPTRENGAEDPAQLEYYVIYQVTEEEYDNCQVKHLDKRTVTKKVVNCSKPLEPHRYFRLQFLPLSPIGGDFDFRAGLRYFYITTSSGEPSGINLKEKGACLEKNMKITIAVGERAKPGSRQTSATPSTKRSTRVTTSSTTASTSATRRTTSSTTSSTTRTTTTSTTSSTTSSTRRVPSTTSTRWHSLSDQTTVTAKSYSSSLGSQNDVTSSANAPGSYPPACLLSLLLTGIVLR